MSDQTVPCSIREAVAADYPALTPIADEVHRLHATAHPAIFQPVERASSLPQAYFDDLLSGESSTIQVAEIAGAIVGFAIVNVFDAPPFEVVVPRRIVFIDSMVVTEAQRGRGIGQALVEAAIAWGRARGATTLELTVWEFNDRARALYERLGLTTIHRTMQREI
ncbi:MAG TPA: GNAT family N-acetyltransferase [Herpetosiphonaceae bacterium]